MGGLYVDWVMFGRCAVMPTAIKSSKGAVLDVFWMLLCRRATCCFESEGGLTTQSLWVAGTQEDPTGLDSTFR